MLTIKPQYQETDNRKSVKQSDNNSDYKKYSLNLSAANQQSGLCSNCIHANNCGFIHSGDPAVMFCEEYNCYTEKHNGAVEQLAKLQLHNVSDSSQNETQQHIDEYSGLCVSCEHRGNCTFSNTQNIIWHCEEFC